MTIVADVHPVDTVGDDRGVRAVCPTAKREDEGRGKPRRRLPHRLQIPSKRRTYGKITVTTSVILHLSTLFIDKLGFLESVGV